MILTYQIVTPTTNTSIHTISTKMPFWIIKNPYSHWICRWSRVETGSNSHIVPEIMPVGVHWESEFAVYLRVELTQDDELLFLSPWKSHTPGNPLSLSSIFYELTSSHTMSVSHFLGGQVKTKLVVMKAKLCWLTLAAVLVIIYRAKTEISLWKITVIAWSKKSIKRTKKSRENIGINNQITPFSNKEILFCNTVLYMQCYARYYTKHKNLPMDHLVSIWN